MELIKINPNNEQFYSEDFIKGFNCGAERQLAKDIADLRKMEQTEPQTEVLTQIHELYADMEKLLRKSSAEIVGAIREQMEKENSNET